MKIYKLNLDNCEYHFGDAIGQVLLFVKPFPSKLHRLYRLPEKYAGNVELIQVLNTLCKRFHNGVWYFQIENDEAEFDMMEIFVHMGIDVFCARTDSENVSLN